MQLYFVVIIMRIKNMKMLSISKTTSFIATLMMATSVFAMELPDVVPSSTPKSLDPQDVKEIARLPLSDPQSYRRWARPDLIAAPDGGEKKFQTFLTYEDPLYKDTNWFYDVNVRPIQNNPGDPRHFGRSFFAFTGIEVPCLLACSSPLGTPPKRCMELGCAEGKMSWRVAAAGALVTANELSSTELGILDQWVQHRVPTRVTSITKIPGSCFDILTRHPALRGSYDVLFSKNLLHFFNDQDAIHFAHLVRDLLCENGTAYITVNAFPCAQEKITSLFETNVAQQNPFPGFHVQTLSDVLMNGKTVKSTLLKVRNAKPGEKMDRVLTPRRGFSPTELISFLQKESPKLLEDISSGQLRGQLPNFESVVYNQPGMLFDTASLSALFQREAGLTVLESFYLNEDGKRTEVHDKDTPYVSVILKKTSSTTTTTTRTTEKKEVEGRN